MFMIRWAALVLALLPMACASTPVEAETAAMQKKPIRGGIAEFTPTFFNGEILEGRLLVGATIDAFAIDGRLVEDVHVELRALRKCGTQQMLGHFIFDYSMPSPRPDQVVVIRRNHWHGANLNFHLFDERKLGVLPDCFDAELLVWSLDGRIAATLPIHVSRTDKTPVSPGSTPANPPASPPSP